MHKEVLYGSVIMNNNTCLDVLDTDFRGVHDDRGDKVEEDVVAVCAARSVTEGHLQLIHGLQQETLALVLKVFKGGFLVVYKKRFKSPQKITTNQI